MKYFRVQFYFVAEGAFEKKNLEGFASLGNYKLERDYYIGCLNIFEPFGIISKICKKTDFFSYTGEGKVHNWTGKMRSKNGIDIMMKSAEPKKISNIQIGNKYELYEIQEVAKENYEEAKSRVLAKRNDEDDGVEEIFDRAHSCP